MFGWLRQIWYWDPGEVPAKRRWLAVTSASAGCFAVLCFEAVALLESKGYFDSAAIFLQALGLSALAAVVTAFMSVLVILVAMSAFVGMILVLSSPKCSYAGQTLRGMLAVVLWATVLAVGKAIG